MDADRFDTLTTHLAARLTRRRGLGVLAALGVVVTAPGESLKAKKKKKKKKPKKCQSGAVTCGAACVDTRTNAQHCGGCGQPCRAGQSCVAGACQGGGGGCTGGREQCGAECVDLENDERHCGACNRDCAGDLTCLSGVCGCAAGTTCGSACVDTQSDRQNCGACGVTCAAGETCSGGQCRAASGYPCDTVYDCGGNYRGVVCRDGQCACENPDEGLCSDPRQGSYAICRSCCPGGNGVCPGDKECNAPPSPSANCDCPVGTRQCAGSTNSHMCQAGNGAQDSNRCGIHCIDCIEEIGLTSFCCSGTCMTACEPNAPCSLNTCSGCQTCAPGTYCCRSGSSNLYGCAQLVSGRCPG